MIDRFASVPFAAALLAAAAVLALESGISVAGAWCAPALRVAIRQTPVNRHPTMARDVYYNDCRLRDCRGDARRPVVFLGGSPTLGLDGSRLEQALAPLGSRPLLWTYPSGVYPLELHALLDPIARQSPRALVVAMGPALFPYAGRLTTRLAFLPWNGRLIEALPAGLWRIRRLAARAALANTVAAFRYRFLLRRLLPALPGQQDWVLDLYRRPPDLFDAAVGELALGREDGERLFEAFARAWQTTGVPLIMWEAPQISDRRLGPLDGPEETARYERLMRRLAGEGLFTYLSSSELPRFGPSDFKNPTHLTAEAGRRLTARLASVVTTILGQAR